MACECHYSYTCPQCQARIDLENQLDYEREWRRWLADSIKKIAEAKGVELDPEPKERGRY